MSKAKTTVSKEIYRKLLEIGDWVASGEMEGWHLLDATGSTITRKARALQEEGYLSVRYDVGTHHALYKANRTLAEKEAATGQTEGNKVRYEPVFRDGKPTGFVRPVPIV